MHKHQQASSESKAYLLGLRLVMSLQQAVIGEMVAVAMQLPLGTIPC